MNSLLTALGLVFVAELGDKTQLVALGFGARHRIGPVMVGVVAGYMTTTLLSVVAGGLLGVTLPTRAVGLAGGVLFLCFAGWMLAPLGRCTAGGGVGGSGVGGDDDRDGAGWTAGHIGGGEWNAGDSRSGGHGGSGDLATGSTRRGGLVMSVAAAMVLAELGDKTMLATATLAAQGPPVPVWAGATLGIVLAGSVGVLLGRVCGARLPERATRVGSAVLFGVSGLALLVANA
ncbi:MAG TPA: TMEM165/GDT1 family protein [Acidimicrobiales bacterium]